MLTTIVYYNDLLLLGLKYFWWYRFVSYSWIWILLISIQNAEKFAKKCDCRFVQFSTIYIVIRRNDE